MPPTGRHIVRWDNGQIIYCPKILPCMVVPIYPKPLSAEARKVLIAELEKGQSEDQKKAMEEARRTIRNSPWSADKDRQV